MVSWDGHTEFKEKVPRFRTKLVLVFSAGFKGAPGKGGALVGETFFPGGGTKALVKSQLLFVDGKAWVFSATCPWVPSARPHYSHRSPSAENPAASIKRDNRPDFPTFDIWPVLPIIPGQSCLKRLFHSLMPVSQPQYTWSPACPMSIRKLMKLNVTERHSSFPPYTLLIALTFFWIAPKPSGLRLDLLIYSKKVMTKNRKPVLCFNLCNS